MKKNERVRLNDAMEGVIKKSKQYDWLTTPSVDLMGKTPLDAIAKGHIEDVINLLNDIAFGIPT